MRYFAYGSNMDWEQMQRRCPLATFICVARLDNFRFDFTRRSRERGCGVMDVLADQGSTVWGVVYQLTEDDLASLDASEGYRPGRARGNAYQRIERMVFQDGNAEQPVTAFVYEVVEKEGPFPPNTDYKALIVNGARHWGLPADYLAQLEAIITE